MFHAMTRTGWRLAIVCAAVLLLGAPADQAAAQVKDGEFPYEWFSGHDRPDRQRALAAHAALVGKPMPRLSLRDWMNTEDGRPLDREDLKGKVVVIDLWATWCGPCLKRVPQNNELYEKYKDQGLIFIGVCGSGSGQDKMASVARQYGMEYPVAKDYSERVARSFKLAWWPTYAFIDRNGMVRAVGLVGHRAEEEIVKALILEEADGDITEAEQGDVAPRVAPTGIAALFEGTPDERKRLEGLQDAIDLPPLEVSQWLNSRSLELGDLRGKVVLLDFWATWSGPCKSAAPNINALHTQYEDRGLVIIGVCESRGANAMEQTVKDLGIEYPVCADVEGATAAAYRVNGYPDYYFIDRSGQLRIADCSDTSIEKAIELLLKEDDAPPE